MALPGRHRYSSIIPRPDKQQPNPQSGVIMNIAKHMETIFIASVIIFGSAAYASTVATANAAAPRAPAATAQVSEVDGLQTVTITAKRLAPAKHQA